MLIVVSQIVLWWFDIVFDDCIMLVEFEVDNFVICFNDGCVDFQGGFWIGMMGINVEYEVGVIYCYYKGELCQLFDKIIIFNVICFVFLGDLVYFVDIGVVKVWCVKLDVEGWLIVELEVFFDFVVDGFNLDGVVVDS